MNKKWSEKTTFEKVIDIIAGVALAVWLIFQMLERTNKVQCASFVNYIAICVVCICEAISYWKVKRVFSYVAIAGVLLLLTVIVVETMLTM